LSWVVWGAVLCLAGAGAAALALEGERRAPLRLGAAAGAGLAAWAGVSPGAAGRFTDLAAAGVGRRARRVDERDTIFARMSYTPGGPAFEDYYNRHPGRREIDDVLRALPDLCGPGSATYDPLNSRIAPAVFDLLAGWRSGVEMRAATAPLEMAGPPDPALAGRTSPEAMAARVKGLARLYRPEFVYTHVGRREEEYGREIGPGLDVDFDHPYAVVFTVEMDYRFVTSAPRLPVVVESSHRYLEAAKVALALAANIRALGWDARAHIDGNYLAVLPPLGAAAGLGEVGRMGLLVTESHGPCVRLGMVSTNLPLACDQPRPFGLQSFCRLCQKCARNCPARAVPAGADPPKGGWRISWEDCYHFWRRTGTDCAICLGSCPYAKPDTFIHRLLRVMVRGLPAAQRAALWLDDGLYGRRPQRKWEPEWF